MGWIFGTDNNNVTLKISSLWVYNKINHSYMFSKTYVSLFICVIFKPTSFPATQNVQIEQMNSSKN